MALPAGRRQHMASALSVRQGRDMSMNVPLPFRVAAGVVAAGLDQLRRLPEELPGLPVALAGSAVRASLRVQQTITELATKGDELLASWVNPPVENPSWARFDDEEPGDGAAGDGPVSDGGNTDDGNTDDDGAAGTGPGEARPGNPVIDGYDELTIGQLRARLRTLDADQVKALLEHERGARARAAFLTTLENRLTSLRAATDGSTPAAKPARP